jgi:hypothetical protein
MSTLSHPHSCHINFRTQLPYLATIILNHPIDIHIKCNVSNTCNILNLSSVYEYVEELGKLFCFPRKIVEFPIHFCLVYIKYTDRHKIRLIMISLINDLEIIFVLIFLY